MKQIVFTAILLVCAVKLFAQGNGHLNGRITDINDDPVPSITVSLTGIQQSVITNEDGVFSFRNIPAGSYSLEATGIGFNASKQYVSITAGKTVYLSLQLNISANTLQEVVVSAIERKSYNSTNK